jgi:hypothetical protein
LEPCCEDQAIGDANRALRVDPQAAVAHFHTIHTLLEPLDAAPLHGGGEARG